MNTQSEAWCHSTYELLSLTRDTSRLAQLTHVSVPRCALRGDRAIDDIAQYCLRKLALTHTVSEPDTESKSDAEADIAVLVPIAMSSARALIEPALGDKIFRSARAVYVLRAAEAHRIPATALMSYLWQAPCDLVIEIGPCCNHSVRTQSIVVAILAANSITRCTLWLDHPTPHVLASYIACVHHDMVVGINSNTEHFELAESNWCELWSPAECEAVGSALAYQLSSNALNITWLIVIRSDEMREAHDLRTAMCDRVPEMRVWHIHLHGTGWEREAASLRGLCGNLDTVSITGSETVPH